MIIACSAGMECKENKRSVDRSISMELKIIHTVWGYFVTY